MAGGDAERTSAADFVPGSRSLKALRKAAEDCRGCPLYKDATQTVFGAGPRRAALMLVGEQPGDREDIEGKRRLHQTPRAGEIGACKPWLMAEIEAVRPTGLLALGATAGRAIFGTKVKVTKDRGRLLESPLAPVAALTLHPSAILRLREHEEREEALAALVADLQLVDKMTTERA
jgi:uracil-DNA glycosylase